TGRDSHNLFGIKAQAGRDGARAEAATTEFEDGAAVSKTESFRNYPDYATAFRDYTRLLQDNPRYAAALNTGADAGAFAQALARGGYATDPNYAAKLTRLATQLKPLD
ncbi:MAG: flagellar rod assembly protein FlgJ, partial [Rhodoferax sp.]|nr:flagellar rod assembly protein FlgJ [Rhodoferax sp.]